MSVKKIPDKNNFLEKFAAIENLLEGKIEPVSKLENKEETQTANPGKIIAEDSGSDQVEKCTNCGAALNPEFAFCGSCGNLNEPEDIAKPTGDELNHTTDNALQNMRKCSSCGNTPNPDDVFCENCGNKLV